MTPHLHPDIAKLLELPDRERQRAVLATKWIPYTRARHIAGKMDDLLHHPASHRMPNLLVVGDTNNGKSLILQRFADAHVPFDREEDGRLVWPVFYIQAPPEPDERRFYNLILDRVGTPYRLADRVDKKQQQVLHILRLLEVKLLVIDEIQHVLAGNQAKQRLFLNVLKYLSNELMIPLVCAGLRTAFNAIQHDEQLANRFEPVALPRWTMGEEYLRLLLSFERLLPLRKPSGLSEEALAYKLLSMSEGTIGDLSKLLKRAAIAAIQGKTECITLALLNRLDYTVPSERMKFHKHLPIST
ncbi:TniB family NTP-binding protein [Hymenobacter coccineus]|uniref:AAA family ATPase n=1 Tax=Hymenobacter coccineus TaxID=1908235 RepID=A0A1G1TKT4_9BACT|nr:TniB family NTP-binding protein [Hymenobacter coccineus]OGX91499.1 AAA family ATPase [Hymenobacter coccineus]